MHKLAARRGKVMFQDEGVLNRVIKDNIIRAFYISTAVAVMELLRVAVYILSRFGLVPQGLRVYYMGMYAAALAGSAGMSAVFGRARRISQFTPESRAKWDRALNLCGALSLLWGAGVTLLDRLSYGQTAAFLIDYVVIASVFVLYPKRLFVLSVLPVLIVYTGLFFTQKDAGALMGDYVSLSVLVVCCTVNSFLRYDSFCESEYYKNRALLLARHDELTGLNNRRSLDEYIRDFYGGTARNVGVLMMDLDDFKGYNDRHGHIAGDQALRALGAMLRDVAANDAFAVRYGGEEFLLFLHGADADASRAVAEDVRRKLSGAREALLSPMTLSVGVCAGTVRSHEDIWRYIDRADQALYRAKGNGRDRVETEEMP